MCEWGDGAGISGGLAGVVAVLMLAQCSPGGLEVDGLMSEGAKIYEVRSVRGEPDEEAWKGAECLTDFSFPWIERSAPATEFKALSDGERFYFRFVVEDHDLVHDESDDAVQRVIGSDRVEIFFACDAGIEQYYCAEMDPRGHVHDYAARFYRDFDREWKFPGLEVKSDLREDGYTVEGSIPLATFRDLGIDGVEEGRLRAGVYRAEFSRGRDGEVIQDWISWVDPGTEEADFHVPASFGEFRFRD